MGQLIDLEFPAATPGCAQPAPARKRCRRIETNVSIAPPATPTNIWAEASARLHVAPVATPNLARCAESRRDYPRIEVDTPIIPWAVAAAVWEEACVWLDIELPRSWIVILAVRANEIYTHDPRFRRMVRRRGNAGRDWLWSFTRHWMSVLIARHDARLHRRLPRGYEVGWPL